jgi:hypothetical protein
MFEAGGLGMTGFGKTFTKKKDKIQVNLQK